MAKGRQKIDPNQLNLFDDFIERIRECSDSASSKPAEGSLNMRDLLRRALCEDIKHSPLSRWEIAGRMSHLVGAEISKYTIDAWTAESKEGHRMPAEYVPAWCKALDSRRVLRVISDTAGTFVMDPPDVLRAQNQRDSEKIRKIRSSIRKREIFLKEMERAGTRTERSQ